MSGRNSKLASKTSSSDISQDAPSVSPVPQPIFFLTYIHHKTLLNKIMINKLRAEINGRVQNKPSTKTIKAVKADLAFQKALPKPESFGLISHMWKFIEQRPAKTIEKTVTKTTLISKCIRRSK